MGSPLLVSFVAGATGLWSIDRIGAVSGESLPQARRLSVVEGRPAATTPDISWCLRGTTSHLRYTRRIEADALSARQEGLARTGATLAAVIPIRKSTAWWTLAQDERRVIIEEASRHIAIGLEYLPAIARRLHHSRDLGEDFDFVTWFEFAPASASAFDALVGRLRETSEWAYVEREVDIRLSRHPEPEED